MVVHSEKGKKISIKTEVALSLMKPFERQPAEHEEEASKRKYEVVGTNCLGPIAWPSLTHAQCTSEAHARPRL